MILRCEYGGTIYKYIEVGNRACLTKGDTKLLWWGAVDDLVPCGAAPLEVLLMLSVDRVKERG